MQHTQYDKLRPQVSPKEKDQYATRADRWDNPPPRPPKAWRVAPSIFTRIKSRESLP